MSNEVAKSDFIAIDASGHERRVQIVVRAPALTADGDWACVVEGDALIDGPRGGIVGEDSMQALSLALAFVHQRLEFFRQGGGRIAFDDEVRTELPLDAQFGGAVWSSGSAEPPSYNDDYPSCVETYSTLRIFSDSLTPDEISAALRIEPTSAFRKGDPISAQVQRPRPQHGWLLCSKGAVHSRDTRRHVDWLLDQLVPVAVELAWVRQSAALVDIYSFWVSARGQGGPMLSVPQLQRLGALGLECSYDVYFDSVEASDVG